jgi:RNA polymerase sigma-70 factor (ECF subfamily)
LQQPSDRDLVAGFTTHGDEEAFRLLFRRYTPRLYAMALRLSGGRADEAEDVIQTTWLRAAGRLDAFEWRSSLSTWLTAIAINCAREARRARARAPVPAPLDLLDALAAPAAVPGMRLDLDRAIAALPDGYREVLVLHDVEGLTHAEIAGALGIAPGTAKSQLFHARRALRRWLNEPEGARHAR